MALSAARVQTRQNNPDLVSVKMKASTTIYQGGGVMFDDDGLAIPAADTANCTPCGVATETKTSPATGDTYISVAVSGVYRFAASSPAAATWIGLPVYWSDDETVNLAGPLSNDVHAGQCVGIPNSAEVDVLINRAIS